MIGHGAPVGPACLVVMCGRWGSVAAQERMPGTAALWRELATAGLRELSSGRLDRGEPRGAAQVPTSWGYGCRSAPPCITSAWVKSTVSMDCHLYGFGSSWMAYGPVLCCQRALDCAGSSRR